MEELFALLERDNFFLNEDKVLVAFSGGPDSIFVFKLLDEYKKIKNIKIHLYHLNHNLRKTSYRDELFVREFAEQNNCTLHLESFDIRNFAAELQVGLEEAGRVKRYESLKSIAKNIGTKTVITAHHFDDDVETMIMNFNRGTGLNGISGIKYRDGIYFRPLLDINKNYILSFLDNNSISYCIDETNFDDDVERNYIRLNKIPLIRKNFNNFDRSASVLLKNLKSSQTMLEDIFEKFLREAVVKPDSISISIKNLLDYFPRTRGDIYLYIIKKINNSKKDIYSYHIQMIDDILFKSEEKHLRFSGIEIIKSYDNLIFKNLECNYERLNNFDFEDIKIDGDKVKGGIFYSKRKAGDKFETRGGKTKKLKDILIDEKIPKYMRDDLTVVRDEIGIIYVENLWVSRRVRVDNDTKNKLCIRRHYE